MTYFTQKMNLPVYFRTVETMTWLGKKDKNGDAVNESTFDTTAFISSYVIADSRDTGKTYKSAKASIRAVQLMIRKMQH